ncbi:MAG: hypothetical protein HC892_11170 [Saprospiraceae bacterium]|nr:hypothetical protein [Saprospiraceae bacterium]
MPNAQQATIKESQQTILTYPFSDPNTLPILGENPKIYPYLSLKAIQKQVNPKIGK